MKKGLTQFLRKFCIYVETVHAPSLLELPMTFELPMTLVMGRNDKQKRL